MARSRGFLRDRGSRRPNRLTSWDLGPGGTSSVSISSTSSTFLGSFVSPTQDGLTVIRTRGELLIFLTAASAQDNGITGAFGIGLATAAALTVGATAVPTPITEQDWDGWIYHRYFSLTAAAAIAASAAEAPELVHPVTAALRLEVDSKAMRKVVEEDGLYAIIEVVESGTAVALAHFNSRMLFKLP